MFFLRSLKMYEIKKGMKRNNQDFSFLLFFAIDPKKILYFIKKKTAETDFPQTIDQVTIHNKSQNVSCFSLLWEKAINFHVFHFV